MNSFRKMLRQHVVNLRERAHRLRREATEAERLHHAGRMSLTRLTRSERQARLAETEAGLWQGRSEANRR